MVIILWGLVVAVGIKVGVGGSSEVKVVVVVAVELKGGVGDRIVKSLALGMEDL